MTALEPPQVVDGHLLRSTLRRHAAGVTVVTVAGPAGFTATSFTPVSLEPPLVSFYLGLSASTVRAVREGGAFAVHVLGHDQRHLAERFSRRGVDRFAGLEWTEGPGGVPLLDAVPAWLLSRTVRQQEIGDHLLVVGQVLQVGGHGEGSALVHHDGTFATVERLA